MAVTKRTRFEVLRRDNYTCRYCRSTDGELTIDHVTPVALGGSDKPDNLVACCKDCNAGKSSASADSEVVAQVADDAVRWSNAIERAAAVLALRRTDLFAYIDAFDKAWDSGYLPSGYENSIEAIYKAGLPVAELVDSVYVASAARGIYTSRFRYFCGVAWKRVREMQDIAAALLEKAADDDGA